MFSSAQEIVDAIAPNEAMYKLYTSKFAGFVRKVTKARLDIFWAKALPGKADELTVTARGVIASRIVHNGKNWYGYTLDPFGPDVRYSDQCDAALLLLKRHGIAKIH